MPGVEGSAQEAGGHTRSTNFNSNNCLTRFTLSTSTNTVDGIRNIVYRNRSMEYLSKTLRLDEEVIAWLDKLKSMHGSYNKGLRLVAFPAEGRGKPAIDVTPRREPLPVARELITELDDDQ